MEGPVAVAERVDLGERRQAALDLLTQYIRIVDDPRRIEEWPALFSDDAEYIVITRENHERNLPIAVIRDDSKDRIADRVTIIREFWGAGGRAADRPYNDAGPRHVGGPGWVEFNESGAALVGGNFALYQSVHAGVAPRLLAAGEYPRDLECSGGAPAFQ